jgi:hypothetical protein
MHRQLGQCSEYWEYRQHPQHRQRGQDPEPGKQECSGRPRTAELGSRAVAQAEGEGFSTTTDLRAGISACVTRSLSRKYSICIRGGATARHERLRRCPPRQLSRVRRRPSHLTWCPQGPPRWPALPRAERPPPAPSLSFWLACAKMVVGSKALETANPAARVTSRM